MLIETVHDGDEDEQCSLNTRFIRVRVSTICPQSAHRSAANATSKRDEITETAIHWILSICLSNELMLFFIIAYLEPKSLIRSVTRRASCRVKMLVLIGQVLIRDPIHKEMNDI